MRYTVFERYFRPFVVISLAEIRKREPLFDRRRLSEWQEKGLIKKLARGFYVFADEDLSEAELFLIANSIYSPSYVSLQSALSYHHLIPEGVYTLTSVSAKKNHYL